MKVQYQLKSFDEIINTYDFSIPLYRFLPSFFKQRKNMGSSDRRWATRYIYSYFRLGQALPKLEVYERLAVADYLCNTSLSLVVETYLPLLKDTQEENLDYKLAAISQLYPHFSVNDVFKWNDHLSSKIDVENFNKSHFIQPDLFIVLKDSDKSKFQKLLGEAAVDYDFLGTRTVRLPNATKLEQILPKEFKYRIQDLSSQETGAYFQPNKYDYWWDCCAASGGKSLLLQDQEASIQLLVSDIRASILQNLDERFRDAGIRKYQSKVLDLTLNNEQFLHGYAFDGIILDAPCTGSGTWGRTPESLLSFKPERIQFFAGLQKKIASNVIRYLKSGKPFIYITCSVFREENEEVVKYIMDKFPLTLEKMEHVEGYQRKADTMFVARMVKA